MEDVLRILVIVVLAIWAGWGILVGLRASDGHSAEVSTPRPAAFGVDDDEGDDERARARA